MQLLCLYALQLTSGNLVTSRNCNSSEVHTCSSNSHCKNGAVSISTFVTVLKRCVMCSFFEFSYQRYLVSFGQIKVVIWKIKTICKSKILTGATPAAVQQTSDPEQLPLGGCFIWFEWGPNNLDVDASFYNNELIKGHIFYVLFQRKTYGGQKIKV